MKLTLALMPLVARGSKRDIWDPHNRHKYQKCVMTKGIPRLRLSGKQELPQIEIKCHCVNKEPKGFRKLFHGLVRDVRTSIVVHMREFHFHLDDDMQNTVTYRHKLHLQTEGFPLCRHDNVLVFNSIALRRQYEGYARERGSSPLKLR